MHLLTFLILLILYAGGRGYTAFLREFNGTNDEIYEKAKQNGDIVYYIGNKTYLTKDCLPVTYYSNGNGDWGYKYSNGKIAYSKQEEIKKEEQTKAIDQGWRTTCRCTDYEARASYKPYTGGVFRDLETNRDYFVRSVMCCKHDAKKEMIVKTIDVCCYFDAITHRIVRLSDGEINHRAWLKKYTPDVWYPDEEEIQNGINYFNQRMEKKEHGDIYAPDYIWVKNYAEKEYNFPYDRKEIDHPYHYPKTETVNEETAQEV